MPENISLWGDSIGKGVIFDESRGRYVVLKENSVSRLSREIGRPIDNYAFMGCTSVSANERMTEERLRPGGSALLELGGNDCDMQWKEIARDPTLNHQPNVPLSQFKALLEQMVTRARAGGMRPALITPPPLDAERYFAWVTRGLNAGAVLDWLGDVQHIYRWQERYAMAVRDVAARTGTMLIDLRDAFLAERSVRALLCVDGIHPNERGHDLIYRTMLTYN